VDAGFAGKSFMHGSYLSHMSVGLIDGRRGNNPLPVGEVLTTLNVKSYWVRALPEKGNSTATPGYSFCIPNVLGHPKRFEVRLLRNVV
jgi:hypothetical protein